MNLVHHNVALGGFVLSFSPPYKPLLSFLLHLSVSSSPRRPMPLTCIAILCIASLLKQFSSKQNAEIRHVHLAWLRDLSTEKKSAIFNSVLAERT